MNDPRRPLYPANIPKIFDFATGHISAPIQSIVFPGRTKTIKGISNWVNVSLPWKAPLISEVEPHAGHSWRLVS